ncbi:VWA domain-containing protein [Clostridium botulinum]|nr:VWA domain-containing protein [Clostridium botulinum]
MKVLEFHIKIKRVNLMRKIKSYMSKLINTKRRKDTFIGVVSIFLIVAMISGQLIVVNAIDRGISDKPSFDVEITSVTPENPVIGEDIKVDGKIIPSDFKCNIPKKEIVLVLDTSGSMKDSKIKKMKNAAIEFVNKIKDVPNVKISIIEYATNAIINPTSEYYGLFSGDYRYVDSNDKFIDSSNVTKLNDMIDKFEAGGGTNTGEALRRAVYLLQLDNDSNIDKSIVLMSDGMPTYYSVVIKYGWLHDLFVKLVPIAELIWDHCFPKYESYYTDITDGTPVDNNRNNVYISGDGQERSNNVEKSTNYATAIGNIIKAKGYNVYSVGYALGNANSKGNILMKKIHESMGGIVGKEGTFFMSDENAINEVFNNIADKIIAGYTIKDVKLNLNLNENLNLNIGGNVVNINNIKYKVDESRSDNKEVVYHAEPVPFSFIIKGKAPETYEDIFKDSFINIPWNNEDIKLNVPRININISENNLPNINAEVKSNKNECTLNENINFNCMVAPEPFKFNGNSEISSPKDVVILLDISTAMKGKIGENKSTSNNKPQKGWDGIVEQSIFNNLLSNNELQGVKTRYNIIAYCNDAYNTSIDDIDISCNSESDYADKFKTNVLNNIYLYDSNKRNISKALKLAGQILDGGIREPFTNKIDEGRGVATKSIIIIGGGSINLNEDGLQDEINSIREKRYNNIITANLGNIDSGSSEPNNNLKDLHYNLIGKKDNGDNILEKKENKYFINVNYRNIDTSNPENIFSDSDNLNSNNFIQNNIIPDIAGILMGEKQKEYNFDITLKFNIGSNFKVVSGINSCEDEGYDYHSPIINVKYIFNEITKQYESTPLPYDFIIQPRVTGELGFGGNNHIIYNNLIGNEIRKPIKIPKTIVITGLKHGVYTGIVGGAPRINSGIPECNKNSSINFGAYFKYNGESKATLNISEENEVGIDEPINIYKIKSNNELQLLNTIKVSLSKSYSINLSELGLNSGDNVLIVYNEKIIVSRETQLPKTFVNTIKLDNSNPINASVNITDLEIPELF